jgi:hypothetical protein
VTKAKLIHSFVARLIEFNSCSVDPFPIKLGKDEGDVLLLASSTPFNEFEI